MAEVSEETGMAFETDESRMSWLETLPEPVRDWAEARQAKSVADFYDQLGSHRSMVARALVPPGEDANDEQRGRFYDRAVELSKGRLTVLPDPEDEASVASYRKAIGVPEAPDGYEFPELADERMPADFMTPERADALRALAHKHGQPASQFKSMASDMLALDAQAVVAQQEAQKAAQGALREEWGEAYDQRYQRLATFLERDSAPPELRQAVAAKNLGPDTAKYLYGVMERMGSESAEIARATGGASEDTVGDAKAKLDEIYGNPEHAFFDPMHPDHAEAMQRVLRLMKAANPGSSTSREFGAPLPDPLLQQAG